MNLSLRNRIAATGAATLIATLGAFATMGPASAAPGGNTSPGTLSGNATHAPTFKTSSEVGDNQGPFSVDPITQQQFDNHADSEYGNNCGQLSRPDGLVKYCEYYDDEVNAGTMWDAYIEIPQGTALGANVTLSYTDGMTGSQMEVTGPIHADAQYVHLSAGVSQWTEPTVQSNVTITLSDGSAYGAASRFDLHNGVYSGQVQLYPN
jgi:hypothetical protein